MLMFLFTFCVDLICIIQYLFTFEFTNCRQAASVLCNTVRHAYTTPTNLTIRTATATTRTHIESLKQNKTKQITTTANTTTRTTTTAQQELTGRWDYRMLSSLKISSMQSQKILNDNKYINAIETTTTTTAQVKQQKYKMRKSRFVHILIL